VQEFLCAEVRKFGCAGALAAEGGCWIGCVSRPTRLEALKRGDGFSKEEDLENGVAGFERREGLKVGGLVLREESQTSQKGARLVLCRRGRLQSSSFSFLRRAVRKRYSP